MPKTFAEYTRERRDRRGEEGREAERVFRAHYASPIDEGPLVGAIEGDVQPQA